MTSMRNDFGQLLRSSRDRVLPGDLGLPQGVPRRVPGLRREELAAYSNLSVDYIVRLERGRAENPSAEVVAGLGRALQLSEQELSHFYTVAGLLPPVELAVPSDISPGVRRLLSRLSDTPVAVHDAAWTFLAGNDLWTALLGASPLGNGGNVAWKVFTGAWSLLLSDPNEHDRFQRAIVADLRVTSGKYPHDNFLRQLVTDLLQTSPQFAALWAHGEVLRFASERKTINHPHVGSITLDCDVLTSGDNDLRIVIYTAPTGSEASEKLGLLRKTLESHQLPV